MSSEVNKMFPDIQEECKATPKPEEEVKLEEEEEEEIAKWRLEGSKSILRLSGDGIFAILLHGWSCLFKPEQKPDDDDEQAEAER